MINIFIQARMSSSRFPGKMLAPLDGVPLIKHIYDRVSQVPQLAKVVVLTSMEQSDDPLAFYLEKLGYNVFRGDLKNVFLRFQQALEVYPCDSFVRICGDSPIISPEVIEHMVQLASEKDCDFFSNVHHKKFPKGQSVEIIKSSIFNSIDSTKLTPDQCEHVMPYFYENTEVSRAYYPDCKVSMRHINTCVDTIEDLKNIESGAITYDYDRSTIC